MNNDLISRSALKKAIAEFHQKENDRLHNPLWGSIDLNALNRLIDNAPTVDKEKLTTERPHGKWIYEEHGYMICSNCGYDCSYNEEGLYIRGSYCYNCGADMRGDDHGS